MESSEGAGYGPSLTLVTRRQERCTEINIKDNASGVSPDIIAKACPPLHRRGAVRTMLFQAMSFVSGRGEIRVESEPPPETAAKESRTR